MALIDKGRSYGNTSAMRQGRNLLRHLVYDVAPNLAPTLYLDQADGFPCLNEQVDLHALPRTVTRCLAPVGCGRDDLHISKTKHDNKSSEIGKYQILELKPHDGIPSFESVKRPERERAAVDGLLGRFMKVAILATTAVVGE